MSEPTPSRMSLLWAVDAIDRAHRPSGCCCVPRVDYRGCASWDDYSDCDCGYVEASENVGDFAEAVLSGEMTAPAWWAEDRANAERRSAGGPPAEVGA